MTTPIPDIPSPSSAVLFTELPDGESVLLNLTTEEYFGLNALGTSVWSALTGEGSVDGLVVATAADTQTPADTVRADVVALLDQLVEKGLAQR
ncbi:MAG: PqqD family protein [Actinomycetota bacterium]